MTVTVGHAKSESVGGCDACGIPTTHVYIIGVNQGPLIRLCSKCVSEMQRQISILKMKGVVINRGKRKEL